MRNKKRSLQAIVYHHILKAYPARYKMALCRRVCRGFIIKVKLHSALAHLLSILSRQPCINRQKAARRVKFFAAASLFERHLRRSRRSKSHVEIIAGHRHRRRRQLALPPPLKTKSITFPAVITSGSLVSPRQLAARPSKNLRIGNVFSFAPAVEVIFIWL